MSEEDVQLALMIFAEAYRDGHVDIAEAIADDALWERNRERIASDARIHFVTPESGGPTVMDQDYQGIEGLRTGWRAWLEPWDRYRIVIDEAVDAGGGRVLLLVSTKARMRNSETEVPDSAASILTVVNDRIVEISFYLDQHQARSDAGLA